MDKALYVAMTGARASLQAQGTVSHNIANTDTPGFKEALANTEAFAIRGEGFASRVDAIHVDAGFNRRVGAQHITGNPLDLSLQAGSWLTVQAPGGGEAYTRGAALSLTPNGQLVTAGGHAVLDENENPIAIPPHQAMEIGNDGTISIIPLGEGPQTMAVIGRIKVVAAEDARLERGLDGLFRNTDPQQPFVQTQGKALESGQLEGSNVDAAGALVQMIQLQRQYEMQVKVIKHGDENARSANSLLRLNG
ncbi:flagellar basal body rod protein FlgF [Stenotrophomonas chelatiphaga]|jgi:flagellar basal-body rod protein FlgF|uniref:Flagellar basal-body rod protein FlgF n=1 Tax=Stenotrophomonas chelatiphaga TaxID=517011 RepID=A0A0R0DC75_9GAMM|nr:MULTISPECIES: flagellar basal body rod protein FlgF [Stenotrophomonas]MBJ7515634.1 flagellar basal body rod protein FlgF [Stenotrophomonas sp.]ROQ47838.1 flagellar basal-body rod protein FlgF [Stenotrophomonas maltophilia]KRG75188.1 flagellar basal body rod protein FlgF [Stenotrophomonas chelatiphaga]MCS4232508.1 flagellar basal-body rod protein FlgF [Stenotrophomonas chelatiphaga]MDR6094356.1 flagellar basal-body rod protein FlgF [Stenotrophomonas sp. SORGH_AS_0321]